MMRRDIVAGRCSGSSCGNRICVVITAGTPARTAFRKGSSSVRSSSSMLLSTQGSARWESVSVSPWPGKCLAEHSTPPSNRPRIIRLA